MNFPTVTIPDPAAVAVWLDHVMPEHNNGSHAPNYSDEGWYCMHWMGPGVGWINARGDTPEALLADIRRQLAERDPVAKLRKEAEAAGFSLVANAPILARPDSSPPQQ